MCLSQRYEMAACGHIIVRIEHICMAKNHPWFMRLIRRVFTSWEDSGGYICETIMRADRIVIWDLCGACYAEYASKGVYRTDALRLADLEHLRLIRLTKKTNGQMAGGYHARPSWY